MVHDKDGNRTCATPSAALAAIVGSDPLTHGEVTSRLWDYIRANELQDPNDKRQIIADEKLRAVFGRDRAHMFEVSGMIAAHLR